MSSNAPEIDLLTPKEVAGLLRLSESTVFDAVARGDLPCIRLWRGRRKSLIRFRRSDITALLSGRVIAPRRRGNPR